MATERIDIVVSESGTRTVRRNLEGLGQTASATEKSFISLKNVLASVGVAFGVREVANFADSYTNLQNRIKSVTENTFQLQAVTKKLLDISNETRQSFTKTSELYVRLTTSSKDLGLSQKELFDFTTSLNQAVAISGSTTRESENAIVQLSQGIAAGALRGDELRSVLEQLGGVADVIAKKIGITRGELKKFAETGAVTTEVIIAAFKDAREELIGKFAKSVPKLGEAVTVLSNNFLFLFGEFDKNIGISRTLYDVIVILTANLETLGRVAIATGLALSVNLTQRGLIAAVGGVRALSTAIRANPLGILATAIIAVSSLLVAFSDKIKLSGEGFTNLKDFGLAAWEQISEGLRKLGENFSRVFSGIGGFVKSIFGDISFSFLDVLKGIAIGADRLTGIFVGVLEGLKAGFMGLFGLLDSFFTKIINAAITRVEAGVNAIIRSLNKVSDYLGTGKIDEVILGRLQSTASNTSENIGQLVKDGFLKGFEGQNSVQNALETTLNKASDIAKQRIQEQADLEKKLKEEQDKFNVKPEVTKSSTALQSASGGDKGPSFDELLGQLQQEGQLLQLSNREREVRYNLLNLESQLNRQLTPEEAARAQQQLEANQALGDQARLYDEINAPREDYTQGVQALNALLADGRISLEDYNSKLQDIRISYLETKTDLQSGVERAFAKVARDASDAASQIESVITNAFSNAEDAFVEFVKTGKLSFKGLVDGIIEDLTRLAFKQALVSAAASAFGSSADAIGGGGGGGAGGGGGGFGDIFGSMFGSSGGASSGGAGALKSAPSPGGMQSYEYADTASSSGGFASLFGFANGGEFQVGGTGGTDSQLVAFRASPNETVKVTKPGQSNGGGDTIIVNINTQDADSFKRSGSQTLSQFAQNLARVKKRNT